MKRKMKMREKEERRRKNIIIRGLKIRERKRREMAERLLEGIGELSKSRGDKENRRGQRKRDGLEGRNKNGR